MKLIEDYAGFKTANLIRPWRVGVGLLIVGLAPLLPLLQWTGLLSS